MVTCLIVDALVDNRAESFTDLIKRVVREVFDCDELWAKPFHGTFMNNYN